MKKTLTMLLSLVFVVSLFAGLNVSAASKTFTENFGGAWDWTKWAHANNDDGDANDDPKLNTDEFVISGGQLHMNTLASNDSFLYLMPRIGTTNKFTITWKMKSNQTNDSWVGVSVMKDTNDRFNGCNNMLIYYRMQEGKIALQIDRGYPGGGGTVGQTSKIVGPALINADCKQWQTYKVDYAAGVYKCYVGNELLGTLNYDKLKNPGYISLNSCIADVLIDDFTVVYDTVTGSGSTSTTSTPASSSKSSSKASSTNTTTGTTSKSNTTSTAASNTGASSLTESSVSSAAAALTSDDFKAKYEDVTVDLTSSIITLSRKLTVSELLTSFKMKDGYTIKAFESGSEITDTAKTVSDSMTLKLYNGSEELASFTLKTNFTADSNVPRQENKGGFPWAVVIIIIVVVVLGGAGAAVYFLKFRKKI